MMNAEERARRKANIRAKAAIPPDRINDFTVGVESQRPFRDTRSLLDIEFGTELSKK
jgi:hypothetical protein